MQGQTSSERIFDFIGQERLFHFMADAAVEDIAIATPHLTDEAPKNPESATATTATTTASPTAAASGTNPTNDPFLKNLFAEKTSTESAASEGSVFQSLVKSEQQAVAKKKSILGELPKIDMSLFIDREFQLKKQLVIIRAIFAGLIIAGGVLYGYFITQLNPSFDIFGANLGAQLTQTSTQLTSKQTEINFNRYRTAKYDLDAFLYQANQYIKHYEAWRDAQTDAEKGPLASVLDDAKTELLKPLNDARSLLTKDIVVDYYRESGPVAREDAVSGFNDMLRKRVADERKTVSELLKSTQPTETKNDLQASLLSFNELSYLIGNRSLLAQMNRDMSSASHKEIYDYVLKFSSLYRHRLAYVFSITSQRLPMTEMLQELFRVTATVDLQFRTAVSKDGPGIKYSSFDFSPESNRIAINGTIRDYDGVNFNKLADLIDAIEGSHMFKDVDMRSFSKSFQENKDGQSTYEGNFRIDFTYQKPDETSTKDKQFDVSTIPRLPKTATPAPTPKQ